MNYKEAIEYIHDRKTFAPQPGTKRISELLRLLGEPQKTLRFIHVAGTNGKGSACAMLASIMKSCGLRTGLFISPHVFRFNERMQINGEQIDDETLAQLTTEVKVAADKMEEKPTVFELITAVAMLWFAREHCGIVILEAGIGGTYDATNVIDCPEAAVIMNIGFDHTGTLGNTIEEIAANKAGIIKTGSVCACYDLPEESLSVVRAHCTEVGAKLRVADFSKIEPEFDSVEGQVFTYKGEPYATPLLGAHQLKNASVVLEVIEGLREKGWNIDPEDVEHGLYAVSWPARFEIVSDEPVFAVDGGHNPQCMETVADNLRKYFPDVPHVILIGVLGDKDYEQMLEIIAPAADAFVCSAPDSPRAVPVDKLAKELEKYGKKVVAAPNTQDAVEMARELASDLGGMVCSVGSLYMAGDVRACFNLY